jgi:hypothetical protein
MSCQHDWCPGTIEIGGKLRLSMFLNLELLLVFTSRYLTRYPEDQSVAAFTQGSLNASFGKIGDNGMGKLGHAPGSRHRGCRGVELAVSGKSLAAQSME